MAPRLQSASVCGHVWPCFWPVHLTLAHVALTLQLRQCCHRWGIRLQLGRPVRPSMLHTVSQTRQASVVVWQECNTGRLTQTRMSQCMLTRQLCLPLHRWQQHRARGQQRRHSCGQTGQPGLHLSSTGTLTACWVIGTLACCLT